VTELWRFFQWGKSPGKMWEILGKPWEMLGKPWENHGKLYRKTLKKMKIIGGKEDMGDPLSYRGKPTVIIHLEMEL
jgi:hypothetical protein